MPRFDKDDVDRRRFIKWAGIAGVSGIAGCSGDSETEPSGDETEPPSDGTEPGGQETQGSEEGPSGTLGDWSVDWNSPEPMLDRLNADEWIPPEFDESDIATSLEQTNAGGMRNDPATAYGHDVMSERVGVEITPIEVPSAQLSPRTTTILSSRAGTPALLQVSFEFYMDLVQPGFLEPVDDLWDEGTLDAFPASYRRNFTTGLDSTLDGDHIYASHAVAEGFFLHHRTDYLEEMGFPSDFLKRPTWSDLREVCEEADGRDYYGYAFMGNSPRQTPMNWIVKVRSQGGSVVEDDGTVVFNSDEGVRALEWMKQLIDDDLVPNPLEYADAGLNDLFLQGNLVSYDTGGDLLQSSEESIGYDNYDVGAPPQADEGPEPQFAALTQTDAICINRFASPEKKRAAMIYLDANRSAEFDSQEWEMEGNMPSNPVSLDSIDTPFDDTLEFVMDRATDALWPQQVQTLNALTEEMQQVYSDQKSPQQALDDAQAQVDGILNQ